jgi:predicted nucleic acid-binding protein
MSGESRLREGDRLIFDTSVLSAFTEAEHLDLLGHYLLGTECFATDIVRDEIKRGAASRPSLLTVISAPWLAQASLDDDEARGLTALLRWKDLVGAGLHDFGEASTFAYAELYGGISVIDDRPATAIGRREGLEVHGSLWLIGALCNSRKLTEHAAVRLVDDLRGVGARLPCTGNEFPAWARKQGLLRTV